MSVENNQVLYKDINFSPNKNSIAGMIKRQAGLILADEITITGTGIISKNILQINGSIKVFDQWFLITEITTLTNMTDVHFDIYDGTNTIEITKSPGATLSSAIVGTFLRKDKLVTEIVSYSIPDEIRLLETSNKEAVPMVFTAKNGADNFLRLSFTTTDNPINFKLYCYFVYETLDGGTLVFV